jgi:uncharacterized membrane protein (DUF4010 family)
MATVARYGDARAKKSTEVKTAFIFAAIYALVLLAVAAAKEHFGSAGFYAVAIVSGLTDMDAITLSSARLVESGRTDPSTGWHAILIAAMSIAWRPFIDPCGSARPSL